MKNKLMPLVYLAVATLLFRRLCARVPFRKTWKSLRALLAAGAGPVLASDLAFPVRNRKIPVT